MSVVGGSGGAFRCTASTASLTWTWQGSFEASDLSSVGLHAIMLPILQPCGSISVMRPGSPRLSATYLQQPYSIRSTASVVSEACRFCTAFRMPKQFTARFSRDRGDCKVSPCRLRRSSANRNDHARTVLLTGLNIQCRAGRFGECDVNTL